MGRRRVSCRAGHLLLRAAICVMENSGICGRVCAPRARACFTFATHLFWAGAKAAHAVSREMVKRKARRYPRRNDDCRQEAKIGGR